ncbi:ketopantoate hydroxymethyltransferase [Hydrogenispora ethanolica]|uniref:3-methyl-2-oxobutanoate hydroxymethyltransferase n=1 Tax=Hydrogenispora ethanolica TaxID=1082276 RepID=A0A4R1RXX4_HYDET|nr:3-methyl-2-oxobutanoate hydroxymethyltransferase [Hydrogenispora ethanolica]TCL71613.1 ketopantoate hydroxymethyltransferase [Hydrogenispora ethanolica]
MREITTLKLRKMKQDGTKLVMVTAYDYAAARLAEEAGVDLILVGDTLGMVVLGYDTTLQVTLEDMIHHLKPVVRGTRRVMVVGDLPFMSYQVSPEQAVVSAGRLVQEGGAQAVKLEGGAAVVPAISRITAAGIPVLGHLGFTPQSVHQLGGAIFQGKTAAKARGLLEDALRLEDAGVCAVVLELVPWEAAELISRRLTVPTIGIGSGPACDGQVLVYHDLLGLNPEIRLKHNKVFAEIGKLTSAALGAYAAEVRSGQFPAEEHTRRMDPAAWRELQESAGMTRPEGGRP